MHGGGVTHLIFPFTAHWVIIREDEAYTLISFHVPSKSMTEEHLCLVPAWGAKTTFVPVVTFTPSQPTVGCLFHFALRFSQLVIAVPKIGGVVFRGARREMNSLRPQWTLSSVTSYVRLETCALALNFSTGNTPDHGPQPLQRTVFHQELLKQLHEQF